MARKLVSAVRNHRVPVADQLGVAFAIGAERSMQVPGGHIKFTERIARTGRGFHAQIFSGHSDFSADFGADRGA